MTRPVVEYFQEVNEDKVPYDHLYLEQTIITVQVYLQYVHYLFSYLITLITQHLHSYICLFTFPATHPSKHMPKIRVSL